MIHLRTLGRFELIAGDAPASHLVPAQPKRLALLTYLAVAAPAGSHRRDSLLALFWPDSTTEDARRALRQALHALRQFLDEGMLETRRDDQVALTGDNGWCDVIAFDRAIDARQWEAGLSLYHGPFLDGVFVADASADFEQWVGVTRDRLGQRATHAAIMLANAATERGDPADAARWAARAFRLAPDDEGCARLLMAVLRDAGDRAQALRIYEAFAKRLMDELGAHPGGEMRALVAALRAAGPDVVSLPIPPRAADTAVAPVPALDVAPRTSDPIAVPRPPRRRWRIPAMLAGAALVASVLLVLRLTRDTPLDPHADRILIADFRNNTRDSLLAMAVTEALRADFSQSRQVRVLSRTQVQATLQRMRQPPSAVLSDALLREVAEREGVKAFVTGEVAALGNGFSVTATLISVEHGEILAAVHEVAADSTQLIGAVDKVSSRLRRGAGESLWSVRSSQPLEQVTTASLEALRLYSQALKIGDQNGDPVAAIPLLKQAVALDTTFAMAYRKLGAFLGNYREHGAAEVALQRAFHYRDRLPTAERYLTIGAYYDNAGMPDSALAAYRMLLQFDPANTRALNNSAAQYVTLHDFHKAEQFRHRALESDSTMGVLYTNLANDQFNSGELDAAAHTLDVRALRFPPGEEALTLRVSLEMARGNYGGAEQRVREMLSSAGNDADRRTTPLRMLSLILLIDGRLGEAEQRMTEYLTNAAANNSPDGYLEGAILLGFMQTVYRHDPARGAKVLDAALLRYPLEAMPPLDRHYGFLAYTYALTGQPERSRALLAAFRVADVTTPGSSVIRDEGDYLRAEGAIQIAENHFHEAAATLARAPAALNNYACPVCALPDLARAYDLGGEPDSAIAVYRRYVITPWTDWMTSDGEFRSLAWRRLGQLYEARGDTRLAILAYQKVADLWLHADAEVQPDLADVQLRLARLRAAPAR
jgi:DNA-binding SARP family transcriptional activator/TolB-like protein/Tfp pilus assembly protein PilF